MEDKYLGDRECPECGIDSLIEKGLTKWECLKCGGVWDADWLDEGENEDNVEE